MPTHEHECDKRVVLERASRLPLEWPPGEVRGGGDAEDIDEGGNPGKVPELQSHGHDLPNRGTVEVVPPQKD